jgi:peptidoglycan-associated lipoprotein
MFLEDNPDLSLIEVQGHSDERGSVEYNRDLSRRRARAVVAYLVAKGVDPSRLGSKGFGARRPVARGADESAWSQNRRVEFVIVGGP